HDMPPRVGQRDADEGPAGVRVEMGRPLACEIRQELQPLGASRRCGRLLRQLLKANGRLLAILASSRAQRVLEPLQRAARREDDAHHVPLAAHGVAERMESAQRIELRLVAVDEYYAGGAD